MSTNLTKFEDLLASGLSKSALQSFIKDEKEGIEIVHRSLEHAIQLVTSFKQVSVDQTSDQKREFNLETTINDIMLTLKPVTKKTKHTYMLNIPKQIKLDSYPGALGQIITNLVNNSIIHAFPQGRVGTVMITATQVNDLLNIQVKDNGVGVPDEMLGRMFDPFFTTKLGKGGSGLGLSIAHTLTTNILKGTITIDNKAEGLAFNILIPLKV
jgi:signal transduction histidine kinase